MQPITSMDALYFDFNNTLHFPPLPKPFSKGKRRHNSPNKNIEDDDDNNNKASRSRIDELNDTMLELIFERLLAFKHLATSKCVSKRWNSIISDPYFVRRLTLDDFPLTLCLRSYRHEGIQCLTVTEHPYIRRHKLRLDFLPCYIQSYWNRRYYHHVFHKYFDIVAYHNDLLITYHATTREKAAFYIANPLTKNFIGVPVTDWNGTGCAVGFAGVVNGVSSTQLTNSLNIELGFRIVWIITNPDHSCIVKIYSSQTGQWKSHTFNSFHFKFSRRNFKEAVTYNNKVHWLGESEILVVDPFDDDTVAPRLLTLPKAISEQSVLGICQNRLQIAQFQANRKTNEYPRIKVWEFVDYDDLTSWKSSNNKAAEMRLVIDFTLKQYMLDRVFSTVDRLCSSYSKAPHEDNDQMICCHPNDANVVCFMYRKALLCCNVVSRRLKVVVRCSEKWDYHWEQRFLIQHPVIET